MLNVLHLADALLSYAVGLLPEDPAELKRLADDAGDSPYEGDVDESDEAVAGASAAAPAAPASEVQARGSREPAAPPRQEEMRRTGS